MKYDKVMMDTAILWSKESYCSRRQVGAVLAKDGRVLITGYNGTIQNMANNCEEEYVICPSCEVDILVSDFEKDIEKQIYTQNCVCGRKISYSPDILEKSKYLKTNEFTVHAEQNIITYAAKEGIATKDCTIYITTSPCKQCSKLLSQAGITRVIYLEEYKDTDGIDFLKRCNIEVSKYE